MRTGAAEVVEGVIPIMQRLMTGAVEDSDGAFADLLGGLEEPREPEHAHHFLRRRVAHADQVRRALRREPMQAAREPRFRVRA